MEGTKIKVTTGEKTFFIDKNTSVGTLVPTDAAYIAAKVNNRITSLSYILQTDSVIDFLTNQDAAGMNIYRRSLSFLLAKVVSEMFPQSRLHTGHSLGDGYYFDLDGVSINSAVLNDIQAEMQKQIAADKPITKIYLNYGDAVDILTKTGRTDKAKLLAGINDPKLTAYSCDDYIEIFDGPLAVRTGILNVFALIGYDPGFMMQFPHISDTTKPAVWRPQDHIFRFYRSSKQDARLIGADNIGDLNQMIADGRMKEFIRLSENLQTRNVIRLSNEIARRKNVKLITIAGPSSSGKTTFSKRLSLQLKTLGITPVTISVDDYFIDRAKTPLGRDGQPNYECLEALDVEALNKNLRDLMDGKPTHLLHYDFISGKSSVRKEETRLNENEIIVMEGIHCLNDALTPAIPTDMKYKIYISALTQINIDDNNRFPTTDNRLIRRIVRDNKYRGHSAKHTLAMWQNVRAGEEKYIFPYQNSADGYFNSALPYELAILKPYVEPLLRQIKPNEPEYAEAYRLLNILNYLLACDTNDVPPESLVREFVGGSFFDY